MPNSKRKLKKQNQKLAKRITELERINKQASDNTEQGLIARAAQSSLNVIKPTKYKEAANSAKQDKATSSDPLSLTTLATGGAYAARAATADESHTNKNLKEIYERSNEEITSKLKDLELRLSRIADIPDQLKTLSEDVSRLESIEIGRMLVGAKTKANQEKNSARLKMAKKSTTENLTDLKDQLLADARL